MASLLPTYIIVKSNPANVIVTGINKIADLSNAVTVEPNPMKDFAKVDLSFLSKKNLKAVLSDITGNRIAEFNNVTQDELIIQRNNLSQGLYFLEITGADFYARKKIIIQ